MPQTELRSDNEMLATVRERAGAIRRRRRRVTGGFGAVAATAAAALVIGVVVTDRSDDPASVATGGGPLDASATSTTLTRPPLTEPEGWAPMASSPLSARADPVTVWTGEEMLVWRGLGTFSDSCLIEEDGVRVCGDHPPTDGAAYDPSTDTWRPLPPAPMPEPNPYRTQVLGAWTGTELIVWGGDGPTGAAYEPSTDTWRPIATSPLSERTRFSLTWTGEELVVWGGIGTVRDGRPSEEDPTEPDRQPLGDGAAYDPVADRWRPVEAADPVPRALHDGVWVGDELVLIGGHDDEGDPLTAVEAYDPATDTLRRLADLPVGGPTEAVWTGTAIVAVVDQAANSALVYDPVADRWASQAAPPVERPARLIWTGREVVVLDGASLSETADSQPEAAALDPASGAWRLLPPSDLSRRSRPAAVWTGTELLVWGGEEHNGFTSTPYADGARYRPGPGR